MLPKKCSKVFFTVPIYSSRKDVLAVFRRFQDRYCYSNSDVMCHVTKHCNMIVPHYTVHLAGHGLYSQLTRPFPSFAEVGQACETSLPSCM